MPDILIKHVSEVHHGGVTTGTVKGPWPISLALTLPSYSELSSFALPCASAVIILPWSQHKYPRPGDRLKLSSFKL